MTFEEMKKIVVDTLNCDEDKVTMEASLTEDLEADSLDAVELNMALEDACGVSIPDEELAKLKTPGPSGTSPSSWSASSAAAAQHAPCGPKAFSSAPTAAITCPSADTTG